MTSFGTDDTRRPRTEVLDAIDIACEVNRIGQVARVRFAERMALSRAGQA